MLATRLLIACAKRTTGSAGTRNAPRPTLASRIPSFPPCVLLDVCVCVVVRRACFGVGAGWLGAVGPIGRAMEESKGIAGHRKTQQSQAEVCPARAISPPLPSSLAPIRQHSGCERAHVRTVRQERWHGSALLPMMLPMRCLPPAPRSFSVCISSRPTVPIDIFPSIAPIQPSPRTGTAEGARSSTHRT